MPTINPPLLLALVLCDSTIREVGSGKISLIGTFNSLFAHHFPCVHPTLSVYAALSDGRGMVPCQLRMTCLETGAKVFGVNGQVDFKDPTSVAELCFQFNQMPLEKPGIYSIEFFADGELLGNRKLKVEQAKPQPQ